MSEINSHLPSVMIVGAGISGLTLALLLERAGIHYEVFERLQVFKPFGASMSLSASVMPMFDQLGLLDLLREHSKILRSGQYYNEKLELESSMDYFTDAEKKFGYYAVTIDRATLHRLLLSQIPGHRIHMGKKMLSHQETGDGIILRFSDNSAYQGDILVGADGANSSVRQCLYQRLDKEGALPKSDKEPFKYSTVVLTGHTGPLDPEKYPFLSSEYSMVTSTRGDKKPFSWSMCSTAHNTISWIVTQRLDEESRKNNDTFRISEWGADAAVSMCANVRDFKMPIGGTIGDLIDATPKDRISKVMLEEKMFKTWGQGRTVLMGDSCHKMTPTAALNAVNAMQDAIVLANNINALTSNSDKEIDATFKAYKAERFNLAKADVETNMFLTRMSDHTFMSDVVRWMMKDPPKFIWRSVMEKMGRYRPQVNFLKPANDKGTLKPIYQPSLHNKRPAANGKPATI